ncbi:DNA/RNA nuclease SfsA [Idiomarina seosinensis]|uniref:DNA/RNA nuclease SfsA n=1 Tax=Idiomarina seosinensis TaxID=281739 RepID=UPI00384A8457
MQFHRPLQRGILRKRYKRFLADIDFGNTDITTVHCPNTGAMTGCAEPGFEVWCSTSDNPKRKYAMTWELSRNQQGHWIVINTQRANALAGELLNNQHIKELEGLVNWRAEQKYGAQNSRIDWLGENPNGNLCFVEVKSVTLAENQQGYFPDTVSTRAQKHLQELILARQQGHRAVILFVVMHSAIDQVTPAAHIDPKYAQLCNQAAAAGVEFYAYKVSIDPEQIKLDRQIKVCLKQT